MLNKYIFFPGLGDTLTCMLQMKCVGFRFVCCTCSWYLCCTRAVCAALYLCCLLGVYYTSDVNVILVFVLHWCLVQLRLCAALRPVSCFKAIALALRAGCSASCEK